jgi:uncharacterized protein involved in exopolysaccharide biosynthesis
MRERIGITRIDRAGFEDQPSGVEPGLVPRREIDSLDLLLVLARRKKPILQVTISAAVLAIIVSLLLPKTYTATATILPPEQRQSILSSLLGQFGALAGLSGADLGLENPADLFVAMLKSRTIADRLIDKFSLRRVYRVKTYHDARRKLAKASRITAGEEGLITIAVTDRDPQRAAELANAYVDDLHSLNDRLAISEASQRRLFYQQKLDAEQEALSRAELALQQVQQKSGLIRPDAQGKAIIDAVATTRAQVAMQEVRIEAMRSYATANNPDLKRAEKKLAGLDAQLAKLERNTGEIGNGNLEVPTRRLPEAELDYLRSRREVKYHESVYEFLSKQLEAARIDEAKDAVILQVVDKAVTPEKKSHPRRLLIILVTTAFAFFASCLGAILLEITKWKLQDPDARVRLVLLKQLLRFSFPNS